MKILMLTCNSSLMDGINRHILAIATSLNKSDGVEVAVCTTFPPGELNHTLENNGVKVYALNTSHGHSISILWHFFKVMKDFKPDILHGHVISFFVGLTLRMCFSKIPIVITCHGITDPKPKNITSSKHILKNIVHRGITILSPKSKSVCYISKGVQQAINVDAQNPTIIYNPIQHITPSKTTTSKLHHLLHLPPSTPIIGTACRIAKVKQPLVFTQVMIAVLQKHPSCHAVIIGNGEPELESEIQSMIRQNNITDRFHLLGYHSEAQTLIREMSCFLLTSQREGMPTTLLEAMDANVPIAFMEGEGGLIDLTEMNCSEDGPFAIVVPKGATQQMADEIIHLLGDTELARQMTTKATSLIQKKFNINTICQQLIAFYSTTLHTQS